MPTVYPAPTLERYTGRFVQQSLFETSDEPAKVMEKIDVSTGSEMSSLAGAGELNLQLGAAKEDDPTLPDDAKRWLVEQIKTRASAEELTKIPRFPGPHELMNWDDLLIC